MQHAEELGRKYRDKPYNHDTPKAMGCDPGFGSSKTAFTVIEYLLAIAKENINQQN